MTARRGARERLVDDPSASHLLAVAGLDHLPTWPGEGLPAGDPVPRDWTPRAVDVERAQRPEWRARATETKFHVYPELTLADRALAALADSAAAERRRLLRCPS